MFCIGRLNCRFCGLGSSLLTENARTWGSGGPRGGRRSRRRRTWRGRRGGRRGSRGRIRGFSTWGVGLHWWVVWGRLSPVVYRGNGLRGGGRGRPRGWRSGCRGCRGCRCFGGGPAGRCRCRCRRSAPWLRSRLEGIVCCRRVVMGDGGGGYIISAL